MTDALLALLTGVAAGAVMTRGGLCFNRALRRAAFEGRPRLLRAFAFAVAAQLVLLPLLIALGAGTLERSADAGGPALLPAAQVVGGLVFGAGMALAGGCVTGMLWKAGSGALALAVAIAGFVAGELLIRGPGDGLIDALDDAGRPDESSLAGLLGVDYTPLALALGAAAFLLLIRGPRARRTLAAALPVRRRGARAAAASARRPLAAALPGRRRGARAAAASARRPLAAALTGRSRGGRLAAALLGHRRRGKLATVRTTGRLAAALVGRRRGGLVAGLALGVVASAAWLAAGAAGYGYGLGFVGAAEGTRAALAAGRELPFQLWLALGVVAGAACSGRPRLRIPDAARSARAAAGGLLMGAGGNIAHGCNIGHGLTGVPLLSLGSLLAIGCMAVGALLTWRIALAPRPALRGTEHVRITP